MTIVGDSERIMDRSFIQLYQQDDFFYFNANTENRMDFFPHE